MDELTKKGLEYINENKEMLTALAKGKLSIGCEEDDWFGFDTAKGCFEFSGSDFLDCIDINIWKDQETDKWKACAYPFEYNSLGFPQTNTHDFVELF